MASANLKATQGKAITVRSGRTYAGKQGLTYTEGVFAENTGATNLCLHLLRIPPGGRAHAHLHADHETAIYTVSGHVTVLHGEGLRYQDEMDEGDFMYIPPNVPHLPINTGDAEAVAVLARTDPMEQESVVLLPELDSAQPSKPKS
jgi:uncharacterized RmlC-like cupin family protein